MLPSPNRVFAWLLGGLALLVVLFVGLAQGSGAAAPTSIAPRPDEEAEAAVSAPGARSRGPPPATLFRAVEIARSPNAANDNNELRGVIALGAGDVWAVGSFVTRYSVTSTVRSTLIEHWTGSAWAQVPNPSPGSSANNLYAVSAVNASDIWAVGQQ